MSGARDWQWKLDEAAERVRTRYEHIGRKSGAPFLAVVYPPDAEREVLKEWRTLTKALGTELAVRPIDVLEATAQVVRRLGVQAVVDAMDMPMPGSDPTVELGEMWTTTVAARVREEAAQAGSGRPVVVLERLAALYPASSPRAVMHALWDTANPALEGPVVLLIPGVLVEARVYSFVGKVQEFMYRGDIL